MTINTTQAEQAIRDIVISYRTYIGCEVTLLVGKYKGRRATIKDIYFDGDRFYFQCLVQKIPTKKTSGITYMSSIGESGAYVTSECFNLI